MGAFEFARTESRLNEMTAPAWLEKAAIARQGGSPPAGTPA
jgi:hypothetical protein